jgi:hypothetical protein
MGAVTSPKEDVVRVFDRETISRAIDPHWWQWFDMHGNPDNIACDKRQLNARLAAADRVLELYNSIFT